MPTVLTLGPVTFDGFEIPERIDFGGRQRLAVHHLAGGGRVVETLGADPAPIRWAGVFSGRDASVRVRTLDRLRKFGQPLLLTWDAWRFLVVIELFEAETASSAWTPYRIQVCVLPGPEDLLIDYLSSATPPVIGAAILGGSALPGAIAAAETTMLSGGLVAALGASQQLAQYVMMQAFSGD